MRRMRMSHIGIRVRDFARSLRFYHDALGFRFVGEERIAAEAAGNLYGAPGEVRSAWLEREGVRIQLLELPGIPGDRPSDSARETPSASPFAEFGPTHLALRVADLDASLRALAALEVTVLSPSPIAIRELDARSAFVADPDGAWIELSERPGD
jgi:catechol 2,3-dioxygenase-like lactoylglutathione lyase family enzyme